MALRNRNLLFLCPGYPAWGGIETATTHLAVFLEKQGYHLDFLVSALGTDENHPMARFRPNMYVLPGPPGSKACLDFTETFARKHDSACIFNQGTFIPIHRRRDRLENCLLVNALHIEPYWEKKRLGYKSPGEWLKQEPRLIQKIILGLRLVAFRLHPSLAYPRLKRYYREQIAGSDAYVVLDSSYSKLLADTLYHGAVPQNIHVIPNAFPVPANTPSDKEKMVLFAGRMTPEPKRVDRLLRIWGKIQDRVPEWELILVGDGSERPHLEAQASESGLKRVQFVGSQPTESFYKRASILCLPSSFEGWPMVIREAQAWGVVPMAFDRILALKSQITDDVDGCIIKSFDEDAFAEKLLELMVSDTKREAMGANAREKARETEPDIIGARWLELLQELSRNHDSATNGQL